MIYSETFELKLSPELCRSRSFANQRYANSGTRIEHAGTRTKANFLFFYEYYDFKIKISVRLEQYECK